MGAPRPAATEAAEPGAGGAPGSPQRAPAARQAELSPGGSTYEAVRQKYGRLQPGRQYAAPLVRGRSFGYDAALSGPPWGF
jgi:hypothetical protein